jgi:hypothetical protein
MNQVVDSGVAALGPKVERHREVTQLPRQWRVGYPRPQEGHCCAKISKADYPEHHKRTLCVLPRGLHPSCATVTSGTAADVTALQEGHCCPKYATRFPLNSKGWCC